MHISVDQTGVVRAREDARVAEYLARLDLTRPVEHTAGLMVRRGIVRSSTISLAELERRLVAAARAIQAATPEAWVRAARMAVSGWVPSRWTVHDEHVEAEERLHVHVHVRRLD